MVPWLRLPSGAQPALPPAGALSGRVVFIGAGHGWTYANPSATPRWFTQRGVANSMVEDYGNLDQMNLFADCLRRAGGAVVPTRPVGFQTNEVVLDNTSPGVRFTGGWTVSSGPVCFGAGGQPAYRFAAVGATETATAAYLPTIPAEGDCPVYAWAAHGANRVNQLYRIRGTRGESQVRVPHHRVGNGWVWLGTFHFPADRNEDTGFVIISNAAEPGTVASGVVVADAIRFGNGLGDVARGPDDGSRPAGVSGCATTRWAARWTPPSSRPLSTTASRTPSCCGHPSSVTPWPKPLCAAWGGASRATAADRWRLRPTRRRATSSIGRQTGGASAGRNRCPMTWITRSTTRSGLDRVLPGGGR